MDYEQKYKEALERAKKWYYAPNADKMPTYANRIIKEIFPELKESKDEKTRKEIIDTLEVKEMKEEPISNNMEYASEKYACRFSSSKYGHDKVKDAFIAGAQWQKEHLWKPSDKQMKAIRIAAEIGTANDSWAMGILRDMYNDLNKLKEK